EFLVGAFKFDVDDNSSDITVNEVPVTVTFTNYDANGSGTVDGSDDSTQDSAAEAVIDTLTLKVNGDDYTAELDSGTVSILNGTG
ncbi:hypothetical protein, partial [Escherichia coli]|uniref:hypothetical protein n=1 Tax=Escherichia coli TaxID=562 RepID=UPI003D0472AB